MLDDKTINPFAMEPKSELPALPQAIPLWTEYCYFHCHDPVVNTGISVHMGREPYDSQIWRATLGIYVPGGEELLVTKVAGRDGHARGGGAGPLRVTCVEPFRLWTLEFDGAVQPVSRAHNMAAAHVDTPSELAKCFLRYEGVSPMWDLHQHMTDQPWASAHFEQICRVSGEITFRGKTYPINGGGVRDHSHGPRNYAGVVSDFWINALFENGASMMVQTVRIENQGAQTEIRNGYLFRNDGTPLEVVEIVEGPVADESLRKFRFVTKTKRGLETVEGEIVHSFATSYIEPNDELLGTSFHLIDQGKPHALQLTESAANFTWNGIKGVGNRERVARISTLT